MDKIETVTIEPPKGFIRLNLKEIWRYRELLYILIWRNLKIRYKQTIVGIGWVIFQPLFSMIIFTIFFGKLAKISSGDLPYPIFVYAALIFWNYFNAALFGANGSLVESQNLIKKIYFPRLIIPLSTAVTPVVDFVLVFIIFFGLMAYYQITPHFLGIVLVPLLLLNCFMSATGLGLLFASVNVRYRDVQILLTFLLQILFFITPIVYPIELVPEAFRWIVNINPIAVTIMVFRSSLFGTSAIDWQLLGISLAAGFILLILGLWYFKRSEQYFADEL